MEKVQVKLFESFGRPVNFDIREINSVSSNLNYSDNGSDDFDYLNEIKKTDPFIRSLWSIHQTLAALRGKMSNRKIVVTDVADEDSCDIDDTNLPPTYLVIQLSSTIPLNTLRWFVEKIRGKKRDGGGELIVMKQPVNPKDAFVLHISATKIKLLEAAEEMELSKIDSNGVMREFSVESLEDFLKEDTHVDDLFTLAERQTIVRHEVENIRALPEDNHIPGFPECQLYTGQSIIEVCKNANIVTKVYPLHEPEALKRLSKEWYMTLKSKQPFDRIKNYFGESVTLYFAFLGFYTSALVIPVVLGFLQLLVSRETIPFFCVFNVVWVTLLLESFWRRHNGNSTTLALVEEPSRGLPKVTFLTMIWKRKSNELAFEWGTIGMTSMDEPRPSFRGTMGIDAISGKVQPQSPRYLTYLKMYAVSIPIVLVCLLAAFFIMLLSFWLEDYCKKSDEYISYVMLPSIIYSIVVLIMNAYYRTLATFLTEWENHRTQSQFERHRVTKLVLFEFVNNFMALFYIAFYIKDMENLRSQLQTMLIISQTINNFQETVQPLAVKYYMLNAHKFNIFQKKIEKPQNTLAQKNYRLENNDDTVLSSIIVPELKPDDNRIKQAMKEGDMEEYEGTYDDYLELFIQFGYVFLFSSVYPLAALWAVLNNLVEIRADAFKLCKIYRRPMCRKVKDIGAWQRAFEVLGALSILTNCGLLYVSPPMRQTMPSLSDVDWLILFVVLEHVLLGIRFVLHIAISDKPEKIRVALAKRNFESKQALKFKRHKGEWKTCHCSMTAFWGADDDIKSFHKGTTGPEKQAATNKAVQNCPRPSRSLSPEKDPAHQSPSQLTKLIEFRSCSSNNYFSYSCSGGLSRPFRHFPLRDYSRSCNYTATTFLLQLRGSSTC
ncbi:unnamed protein product [Phyllotreta striolata]|uniref:Anoctamin n=1 Tax=Phyllotreta striolata TaxID=444603 RepID=A0A9N9XMJ3_PHYSR|nr:unnamed protein product [Phyllotreta striolata]